MVVVDRASLPEILKATGIGPKTISEAAILYESNGYLAMSNDIADQVVNKWQAALKKTKKKTVNTTKYRKSILILSCKFQS